MRLDEGGGVKRDEKVQPFKGSNLPDAIPEETKRPKRQVRTTETPGASESRQGIEPTWMHRHTIDGATAASQVGGPSSVIVHIQR